MPCRIFAGVGLAVSLGALSGCAPAVVWDRPGLTPAEYAMDSAQCQMIAESENPDPGVDTISTGKIGRDIAANLVVGLIHGAAQNAAVGHTFDLCMAGRGYSAHAPSELPLPAMAAAQIPDVPRPPSSAIAAAPITVAPPVSLMAAAPAPMPVTLPYVPLRRCSEERSCYREQIVVPGQ